MAKTKSWEAADDFWKRVEPLVSTRERSVGKTFARQGRRKLKNARLVFEGIVYVLRMGCQWKALPNCFGSSCAIYTRFFQWENSGLFEKLWKNGLAEYDDLQRVAWQWQSIDGAMMKAQPAQETVGSNPTDWGKNGSNHLCADAGYTGVPALRIIEFAKDPNKRAKI